jgi:tRNA (guanine-N7-)-methyltransferase
MEILPRTTEFLARRQERQTALRQTLAEQLPRRGDIVLEIGAGHGHFLTGYANAHPATYCVGIDIINERVLRANRKRDRARLPNVIFLTAEAAEFLDCLPPGVAFRDVFVLFPDPWPKRRHQKNRLIQPEFLSIIARRAGEGARLLFRTDHAGYFQDASATISGHVDWTITPNEAWPFELTTVFQARAPSYASLIATKRSRPKVTSE